MLQSLTTPWKSGGDTEEPFSDKEHIKGVITLLTQTYSLLKALEPTAGSEVIGYTTLFKGYLTAPDDEGNACRAYQVALSKDEEDLTELRERIKEVWKASTIYVNPKTMVWYLEACNDYHVSRLGKGRDSDDEDGTDADGTECAYSVIEALKIALKYLSIQQSDDDVSAVTAAAIMQVTHPFSVRTGTVTST